MNYELSTRRQMLTICLPLIIFTFNFHSCTVHFWYYQVFSFVQLMHN